MLNLYYICNCGDCLDYRNRDNSIVNQNWPSGNEGTASSPYSYNSFRSITTTENIDDNPPGYVNYFAGKTINLEPGFFAKKSSVVNMKIQLLNDYSQYGEEYGLNFTTRNGEDSKNKYYLISKEESKKDTKKSQLVDYKTYNNSNEFVIYPNPVEDVLYVESQKDDISQIILCSLSGTELINNTSLNSKNIILNLINIPPGIYILEILYNNKINRVKIVKN